MKRYRFRLEALLRVRRLEETSARGALARASAGVAAAVAEADQAAARYRREVGEVELHTTGGDGLVRSRAAAAMRARTELEAQRTLAVAVVAATAARETWAAAARRVEALERLDEKDRASWAVDARRAEDAEVDDLVTGRHGRAT